MQEACVLDGDDGLCGKVFDRLNLFVGERANLLAIDDNIANQRIVSKHGHCDQRPSTRKLYQSDGTRIALLICCIRSYVRDLDYALSSSNARERMLRAWAKYWFALRHRLGKCGRCIVRRSDAETAAFVKVQNSELGLADAGSVPKN